MGTTIAVDGRPGRLWDTEAVRVYVELPQGLDVDEWGAKHAAGRAPDLTPYGLGRLTEHGFDVAFRRAPIGARAEWLADRINPRLGATQVMPMLLDRGRILRDSADVLLSMDERTGLPSALAPSNAAVVSGVAWLDDPDALSPVRRRIATVGLHRMAAVFTECSGMRAPLVDGFGLPPEKVHVIRLGIDADFFTPTPYPSGPPMIFSVGDDVMRDHDTLLRAVEQLRVERQDVTLELGTTLPVDASAEWCITHPRRLDEQVRGFYERASLVAIALHPNLQGSGLTVVLETMASGRPLIVSDNPGMSDYVEHGVTGLLVPPGDPAAMADAMARVLADPEWAAAMGRAGRRRVAERFTTAHMIDDLSGVLHHVAGR